MTNTNQSAHFLRSIARGTSLDTDAVYTNPAGVVFMDNGFHIGINDQMAYQTRTTTSTFAPFALGANNGGQATKEFQGSVFSPLVPSVHAMWKHNRWAIMLGMGVNGGGGTIEYNDGLASFERQFSVLPAGMKALGIEATGYGMDMMLKGSSMTLAFNAGAAFRITDWLSVAAQIRYSSTSNGYEGHMKNIGVVVGGQMTPATTIFNNALNTMKGQFQDYSAQYEQYSALYQQLVAAGMGDSAQAQELQAGLQQLQGGLQQLQAGMQTVGENAVKTADHTLDVKQKGHSISPIVALAMHTEKWDASVKYAIGAVSKSDFAKYYNNTDEILTQDLLSTYYKPAITSGTQTNYAVEVEASDYTDWEWYIYAYAVNDSEDVAISDVTKLLVEVVDDTPILNFDPERIEVAGEGGKYTVKYTLTNGRPEGTVKFFQNPMDYYDILKPDSWTIDTEKCVKCGACVGTCKFKAISKQ